MKGQMRLEGTEVPSKVRPIPHEMCVLGLIEVQRCREVLREVRESNLGGYRTSVA